MGVAHRLIYESMRSAQPVGGFIDGTISCSERGARCRFILYHLADKKVESFIKEIRYVQ